MGSGSLAESLAEVPSLVRGRWLDGVWVDWPGGVARLVLNGTLGFGAGVHLFPGTETAVVVWANGSKPVVTERFVLRRVREGLGVTESLSGAPATPGRSPRLESWPHAEWAGTYTNGDRIIVLVDRGDALMGSDGQIELPIVAYEGGGHSGPWPDFRLVHDEAGRRYVVIGQDLAYLHDDDAPGR